ncbi:pyrroline-5-carboxylate reductase [Mycoplasmatota bacterium zrk1]
MKNIGFIGCGNIATAMIAGISKSSLFKEINIYAYDIDQDKLQMMKNDYGINLANSNIDLVKAVEVVVLAVKPNIYETVTNEIKNIISKDTIIVVIAAGISLDNIKMMFNRELKYVRAMPNTPALVGEGMTALCYSELLKDNEKKLVADIFSCFGKYLELSEDKFSAFTSVCGSSPAFVYMFIEALADGGVLLGLQRHQIYDMVSQAILGSAKMVLETKEHPGKLKDNVCSPGGTAIEGVAELERNNFRNAVISAVIKTGEKSRTINN